MTPQEIKDQIRNLTSQLKEEEKFGLHFEMLYEVSDRNGWGDPFNYNRGREIHMANELGHQIASTFSGEDASDKSGKYEYKSTTQDRINGTYNGISVQDSWNEQVTYLEEEKIKCYNNHYIARYEGAKIVEMYRLNGEKVYDILLPKLQKDFERKSKSTKKDPRLSASLSMTNIKKNGERIR
tara:strand:- start:34 stop:579 length:546 start_codon:yes stop_codon:yes gene_type:complete